jgi:hypothetical protein
LVGDLDIGAAVGGQAGDLLLDLGQNLDGHVDRVRRAPNASLMTG